MGKTLGTTRAQRRSSPLSREPNTYGEGRARTAEKAQCWMLTLNLKDPESAEARIALNVFNAACQVRPCTFAVFQPEVGEQGTYHIQAYVELENKKTLKFVKDHFGQRVHAEVRRGTQEEAIAYCTKEDTRVEGMEPKRFGTPMKPNKNGGTRGSRTDWQACHTQLQAGDSVLNTLLAQPALTPYIGAISKFKHLIDQSKPRHGKPDVLVLYGDPGTGKTRTAFSMCGVDDYFALPSDSKEIWFDGYDPQQHKTLILDEFTGAKMPLTFLNQLLDRYNLRLPTKGAHVMCQFERVIITSNFAPKEWYRKKEECLPALMRRIDTLVELRVYDQVQDSENPRPLTMARTLHVTVHSGRFNRRFLAQHSHFELCTCTTQQCRSNEASLAEDPSSDEEPPESQEPRDELRSTQVITRRRVSGPLQPGTVDLFSASDDDGPQPLLKGRKQPLRRFSSGSSGSSADSSEDDDSSSGDSGSGSLSFEE